MLFYKVEGTLSNISDEEDDNRRAQRANSRRVAIKSNEFNEKYCRDSFYFVCNSSNGIVIIGIITNQMIEVDKKLNSYLKYICFELKDIVISEVTINSIQNLLTLANHQDYISDSDKILEDFGLDLLGGRHNRTINFKEKIIDELRKKDICKNAENSLSNKTLLPELNRIYANVPSSNVCGHPVHYVIQVDDNDALKEAYKSLLQALYANNRLSSKRYCFLDFKPGEWLSATAYDVLYKVCAGGAVVVHYLSNDDSEDDEFASSEMDLIEKLCETAKKISQSSADNFLLSP